jgi:pyruvate formate lyase activating enzyme
MTMPVIASATLHPAPPESYTVFMAGCNYKCLNCQNWTISQYPDNGFAQRGYQNPDSLAKECIEALSSRMAATMGADRIFFSGGEPTIHLPYIEAVVQEARRIRPDIRVNYDTNGYLTEKSLERVLAFTTSITYDIKAFSDEIHRALTGASVHPVLRNAAYLARHGRDKIWEYRILVIPQINEGDIKPLTAFLARLDPSLPVCFLAFRPNFVLENHPGAGRGLMEHCLDVAKGSGLSNIHWAGYPGIAGTVMRTDPEIGEVYRSPEARLAASYARDAGCRTHPRSCPDCPSAQACPVKTYTPTTVT